jgi:hypothetical protein
MADTDDMKRNNSTSSGAYTSADQPQADSQGATPASDDDVNQSAVSAADHRTISGDDAKLYGQTRQELGKSSWIATARR